MAETDVIITTTVLTHRGGQRPGNEDAVVVGTSTLTCVSDAQPRSFTHHLSSEGPLVVAVADGLGGHAAGEVASAHTVQRLAAAAGTLTSPSAVVDVLLTISAELTAMGERNPDQKDMGTTVVGLAICHDQTLWFNVGDSRAYRLSGGYLGQMSIDDTPTAVYAEAGATPVPTGVVTQVLGPSQVTLRPHTGVDPSHCDDVYLLCSDGLSDLVTIEEMERLVAKAPDDQAAVRELWAAAMNQGGRDNITIVLVRRSSTP